MRNCAVLLALLLICAGCATLPPDGTPAEKRVPVPSSTRVLGQATVYLSAAGEKLEVVHDANSGIVIVKLPDERLAILPPEIVGTEGRYRDDHLTLWETDGGVLLWLDGKLLFSGRGVE